MEGVSIQIRLVEEYLDCLLLEEATHLSLLQSGFSNILSKDVHYQNGKTNE
jgi:hypothetical protein